MAKITSYCCITQNTAIALGAMFKATFSDIYTVFHKIYVMLCKHGKHKFVEAQFHHSHMPIINVELLTKFIFILHSYNITPNSRTLIPVGYMNLAFILVFVTSRKERLFSC